MYESSCVCGEPESNSMQKESGEKKKVAELQLNEYVQINHKKNESKGRFMQRKHELKVESLGAAIY